MVYDFTKLIDKIKEVYGNRENFAIDMKISRTTMLYKLRGGTPWKIHEAHNAVKLLGIPEQEIPEYFFKEKVPIMEHKEVS